MTATNLPSILLVEDDLIWGETIKNFISKKGMVTWVENEYKAAEVLKTTKFDMAFIDLDLDKRLAGLEIVKEAKKLGIYSIISSSNDDSETIEKGYAYGSSNYLIKSGEYDVLEQSIYDIFYQFEKYQNESRIANLINTHYHTLDLNTLESLKKIKKFDENTSGVFIVGETGVGKKVVADIVNEIINETGLIIRFNCAAINKSTMMSELFGHAKGSFTGANSDKKGILAQADNGVLFLDEIHELPLEAQKALLVAIEENTIRPVGSDKSIKINVKIICASREDINKRVDKKEFLIDLYYRLCKRRIDLYPLRNRRKDILFQLDFFLNRKKSSNLAFIIKDEAKEALEQYDWMGNTRELENLVDEWMENSYRIIDLDCLPIHILKNEVVTYGNFLTEEIFDYIQDHGLASLLDKIKSDAIERAFQSTNAKHNEAAKLLGLNKSTLNRYMKKINGGQNESNRIH